MTVTVKMVDIVVHRKTAVIEVHLKKEGTEALHREVEITPTRIGITDMRINPISQSLHEQVTTILIVSRA